MYKILNNKDDDPRIPSHTIGSTGIITLTETVDREMLSSYFLDVEATENMEDGAMSTRVRVCRVFPLCTGPLVVGFSITYVVTIYKWVLLWWPFISGLWFLKIFPDFRIFFYKCSFASKCSWKKRSSHQWKKEVACIMSKSLVSCLWGCGESVNPPKLYIQEVQRALSSTKGISRPANRFLIFFDFLSNHAPFIFKFVQFVFFMCCR